MMMEGLEVMVSHFPPHHCHCTRDVRTWTMLRCDQEVSYRKDYILGTDFYLFQNISAQCPRHNIDHYLVWGCLLGAPIVSSFYWRRPRNLASWSRPIRISPQMDCIYIANARLIRARMDFWIMFEDGIFYGYDNLNPQGSDGHIALWKNWWTYIYISRPIRPAPQEC